MALRLKTVKTDQERHRRRAPIPPNRVSRFRVNPDIHYDGRFPSVQYMLKHRRQAALEDTEKRLYFELTDAACGAYLAPVRWVWNTLSPYVAEDYRRLYLVVFHGRARPGAEGDTLSVAAHSRDSEEDVIYNDVRLHKTVYHAGRAVAAVMLDFS